MQNLYLLLTGQRINFIKFFIFINIYLTFRWYISIKEKKFNRKGVMYGRI